MNGVRQSHVDPIVLVPGAPVPFRFNGFDPSTDVNPDRAVDARM
jgi:hypothetical protein